MSLITQPQSVKDQPGVLFQTTGDISLSGSGWTFEAGAGTNMAYLPFEGSYPDKGGRLQSPVFSLGRAGNEAGYFRLQFNAASAGHCYWWLDYFDRAGQMLPDCNSAVYPGAECLAYDEIVYVPGAARRMQVAFVSKEKVRAGDVRVAAATAEDAARWCDRVYEKLPPLSFKAPADAMELLPKTAAALKSGRTWRAVMLGDSIVNDSFNSVFQALVQRDFPGSKLDFIASVRGCTGCPFYRTPEEFKKYVADYKPDLLMIGGISNFSGFNADESAAMDAVIKMAREQAGCEVLVMSQPLSADWRKNKSGERDWRKLIENKEYRRGLDYRSARACARKAGVAFWDLTAPCHDYLSAAGNYDFNRDGVHNNDRGKQVIGRVLREYFRAAR
ncbi:MAG: SGNH/GDSL hydrolase family protein [Kiritimatiellia bacterium]